jgi:hypothetical protein
MSINRHQQFVQTGWTYQRVDGGPDLRYKSNPPTGYNKVVGYVLQINGTPFEFSEDPSNLLRQIGAWCDWWFRDIEPRKQTLIRQAPVKLARFNDPPTVRCPGCGDAQRFVEGKRALSP